MYYTSMQEVKTFVRSNYAVANVYLRDQYVEVTTKGEAIDLITLGGTLGGNLGLCIGASLMTWVRRNAVLFGFGLSQSILSVIYAVAFWFGVVRSWHMHTHTHTHTYSRSHTPAESSLPKMSIDASIDAKPIRSTDAFKERPVNTANPL